MGINVDVVSSILTCVPLVTTVCAFCGASGFGWETLGVVATLIVRLPCDMAHAEIWTDEVATMVPVRSFTITLALTSGSIPISSIAWTKPTALSFVFPPVEDE